MRILEEGRDRVVTTTAEIERLLTDFAGDGPDHWWAAESTFIYVAAKDLWQRDEEQKIYRWIRLGNHIVTPAECCKGFGSLRSLLTWALDRRLDVDTHLFFSPLKRPQHIINFLTMGAFEFTAALEEELSEQAS